MLLIMVVTLYTSRVVLNTLGVEDYGVFNVVGGFVSMLAFLNGSMSLSTQRYLAYSIGRKETAETGRVFSMSLTIHILIAFILIVLAETVGLWFFLNYFNIPAQSRDAAMWVYQFSIVSAAIGVVIVPYTSLVIAHERMNIYAYISILEVLLKLGVVFLLTYIPMSKLKLYAILTCSSSFAIACIWKIYCGKKYPYSHYRPFWERELFTRLISFAGWQTLGTAVWLLRTQGVSVLLNIFFGPVMNAARGIAVSVNAAVMSFVQNFQMASNPQITKSYAVGAMDEMHKLIIRSSKFSFLLMFILALPIIMETEPILKLWLKIVPDYGVTFVRLMLVSTLFELLSGTLVYGALATGRIRNYQTVISSILFAEVICVYVAYECGMEPQVVFYIEMVLYCICLMVRLLLLRRMIGLSICSFLKLAFLPEVIVVLVSVSLSVACYSLLPSSVMGCLSVIALSLLIGVASTFCLGLDRHERTWLCEKAKVFRNRIRDRKLR